MKHLKFLKNKYRGNRIFVLGTGKSLKDIPLRFLRNEYTFGINRIGMKYLPTFYWLATRQARDVDYRNDVNAAIDAATFSFIADFLIGLIPAKESIYWMNVDHVDGDNPTRPGDIVVEDWVKQDIAGCKLSGYGHSGFAVIRLAAYMGFHPIYLLGMEGKYFYQSQGQPDPNHFDDKYETGKFGRPQELVDEMNVRIQDSHNIMKVGAHMLGVDIVNAGSRTIKQYPWVKFKELFKWKNSRRFMMIYRSFLSQNHMSLGKRSPKK